MNTNQFSVSAALRADLAAAVADAPQMARLLASKNELINAHGQQLTLIIQEFDQFIGTHRTAARNVRLFFMDLRHHLISMREAEELADNPSAQKDLHLVAERLGRKAQSGFSSTHSPTNHFARLMEGWH